jgi:thioredoxin 1
MKNLVEMDDKNFDAEISGGMPVLVDFSAEWCGPCKLLAPVVDEIAGEFSGRLKVGHVDIDASRTIAARYSIMAVPTLLFFKDGRVCDQITGNVSKKLIVDKITRIL